MIRNGFKIFVLVIMSILLITGCGKENDKKSVSIDLVTIKALDGKYYVGDKPKLEITYNEDILVEGTHYKAEYSNYDKPGKAEILITGINDFEGSRIIQYEIIEIEEKISIEKAIVTGYEQKYLADGTEHKPKITVTLDEEELIEGEDYEVTYGPNKDVGLGIITITAVADSKYTGHIIINFSIIEDVKDPVITCKDVTYNGSEQTIATCENGEISGEKKTNAGTYSVNCVSKSNSNIKAPSRECTIKPKDISSATVSITNPSGINYESTGSAITPNLSPIIVTLDGRTLILNTDYTMNYINNVNPGAVKVIVTGKGNYTGSVTPATPVFYIYAKNCGKTTQNIIEADVDVRGETVADINNMYKENGNLYIELVAGESGKVRFTIPAICTAFDKVDDGNPSFGIIKVANSNSAIDYKKYFTVERNDPTITDNNAFYTLTINTKDVEIPQMQKENGKRRITFMITQERSFTVKGTDKVGNRSIRFTGGTIYVTIIDKTEEKKTRENKDRCCCMYMKDSELSYCTKLRAEQCPSDFPYEDIEGKKCQEKNNFEYKCNITVDKGNNIVIWGYATDGVSTLASIKESKTLIDGVETKSISNPQQKRYSGIVYFSDGGSASCSVGKCCCDKNEKNCEWSWGNCVNNTPTEVSETTGSQCRNHNVTVTPKPTTTPTPTTKPTPTASATHTCTLNVEGDKLIITGSASNGASITRKVIDGVTRSYMTITAPKEGSKTYLGSVYFSDGGSASCSTTIAFSPSSTGVCCCNKYQTQCTWREGLSSCSGDTPIKIDGATRNTCQNYIKKVSESTPTPTSTTKVCCCIKNTKVCKRMDNTCSGSSYSELSPMSYCGG